MILKRFGILCLYKDTKLVDFLSMDDLALE